MSILDNWNSCRGKDARKIVAFVSERQRVTIGEISARISRGTAYVRSLVDELVKVDAVDCDINAPRVAWRIVSLKTKKDGAT